MRKQSTTGRRLYPTAPPFPFFRQYLHDGHYPFSKEGAYKSRLDQIITQALETDIPQFARLSVSTIRKLRRLMAIVAQSAPFKPDYSSIANAIGVSRNVLPVHFLYMVAQKCYSDSCHT